MRCGIGFCDQIGVGMYIKLETRLTHELHRLERFNQIAGRFRTIGPSSVLTLTPWSLHGVFCNVVCSILDLSIMHGSWLNGLDLLGVTLAGVLKRTRTCQHVGASLTSSSHSCRSDTC